MLNQLQISDLAIIFGVILLSMSLHEAMHAFVSHWLGDTTARDLGRLTLNPLKHIDIYTTVLLPMLLIALGIPPFFVAKPVPFNPDRVKFEEFGAALIGVAGPITNFLLATVAALVVRLGSIPVGTDIYNIFSIFIIINLAFFVFNMIPFPPLDGSRLLYAFAPEPLQKIMFRIESAGFMTILFFMLIFFSFLAAGVGSIVNSLYIFLMA